MKKYGNFTVKEARDLLKRHYGFTIRECDNYLKRDPESNAALLEAIAAFDRDQAKKAFYND
jgi:hypothetical protein